MKLEDLVKWVHSDFSKWRCGLHAGSVKTEVLGRNGQKEALLKYRQSTLNSGLNFKDVLKEKADLGKYNLHFYSTMWVHALTHFCCKFSWKHFYYLYFIIKNIYLLLQGPEDMDVQGIVWIRTGYWLLDPRSF